MVIKQRVKRIYKSLPPHSNEAFPLTNTGEANKALIIGIIAIVAVIALSLLLFFTDTFVGKGIEYKASKFVVQVLANCGNGVLDTGETCDDGDKDNGDGCSSLCKVESGYTCTLPTTNLGFDRNDNPITLKVPSQCTSKYYIAVTDNVKDIAPTYLISCGNAVLDTGETCDDKDKDNGDGCSSGCQEESGWKCSKPSTQKLSDGQGGFTTINIPSTCSQIVCGDGIKEGTEQCDDGDMDNGDGCSASCQTEAPPAPAQLGACPVFGDYNGDGKTNSADTVKFNWHVLFGDNLGSAVYGDDSCGGLNENSCLITGTTKYICDDGTGLASTMATCPGGCLLGDYNSDGKTNSADTVKFNWHVLFGDNLGSASYGDDNCGATGEAPCSIGSNGKFICDDGSGLADNANVMCS